MALNELLAACRIKNNKNMFSKSSYLLLCLVFVSYACVVHSQPHCIFPNNPNSTDKIVCYGSESEMRSMLNLNHSSPPERSPNYVDSNLSNHKLNVDPVDRLESRSFPPQTVVKRNRVHFVEPEPENDENDDNYEDDSDQNDSDRDRDKVYDDQDEPPKRIFLKRIPAKPHSILVPVSENTSGFQKPYVTYYHTNHRNSQVQDSEPQPDNNSVDDERRVIIKKVPEEITETRYIKTNKPGSYEPEASEYYHGYVPYESPGQYYSNPIYRESYHPPPPPPPSRSPPSHRPIEHHVIYEEKPISSYWISKLKSLVLLKGVSTKALFLATLPLLLGPLLSYLATPVVIPITANVAAGRRRRRRAANSSESFQTFHYNTTQILRMLNESQYFNQKIH